MKELKLGALYYEISRHNPPALAIEPGETVRVETQDTFNGLVQKEGDHRDIGKKPYGNPQSGPIFVEGAEQDDSLAVHIEKIEARTGQAANDMSWGRRGLGEFLGMDVPRATRICPVRDGKVWWNPRVGIPYAPMIGTIGTAPAMGSPTTGPAGPYGGNMDIKEVTEGNTLYLPVFVDGALLHLGDVHAAQGDGELCGTALEMPGTVTIRVELLKGKSI
ncbi:MAG: acetamidase/formamidase family protein, partial [Actinobacteria bacterium]|nr:acetamidase/formamidase family protein [Actinomycetota bacterium]